MKDPFFISTLTFWVIATITVSIFTKADIHLYTNQFHNSFFDWFFCNITWLGDGLVVIAISLILVLYKVRYGMLVLSSYLVSGIFVQLMKRLFFSNMMRPKAFFEGMADLYFVPGVEVHSAKSFPSGHSTTVFACFACFALLYNSRYARFIFFVLALLTGYSRIYLSQHFLIDVFIGSIIGTLTTYMLFPLFRHKSYSWMEFQPYKSLLLKK